MVSKWITITWTRIISFLRRYHYFSQASCDWLTPALPSPLQVLFCHRRRVSRPGCQLLAWAKMCFKCCCRLVMRRAACQAAGLWRQMRESVVKKQAFAWAQARIESTAWSRGIARGFGLRFVFALRLFTPSFHPSENPFAGSLCCHAPVGPGAEMHSTLSQLTIRIKENGKKAFKVN